MQNWDGIVDHLPNPERTWFARVKETDPWKPLRKCDCKLINAAMNGGKKKVRFNQVIHVLVTKVIYMNSNLFWFEILREDCCVYQYLLGTY